VIRRRSQGGERLPCSHYTAERAEVVTFVITSAHEARVTFAFCRGTLKASGVGPETHRRSVSRARVSLERGRAPSSPRSSVRACRRHDLAVRGFARFLEPPRLRTIDSDDGDRRATWLELFFDLVFVVAVAQLGQNLTNDHSAAGFFAFLGLFVPVWWAWAGFTFYANRFDTDDLVYRLLCLVGMFTVAALATTVPEALRGGSAAFAVAYVGVRLVILVLYARAIRHVDEGRAIATLYFRLFAVSVLVWLASLGVDEPARYWLWALALTIEITAPLFGWRLIPHAPISAAHIPERFGLLTIIVLGESVFAVVLGVEGAAWQLGSVLAAAGGFVAAAALWWIYFEFLDSSLVVGGAGRRRLVGGLVFTYSHFPVITGLAALGVGVKFAILSAGGHSEYDGTAWVLCAGVALCMAGMAAIQLATPPTLFDLDVWLRMGTAVLALVLLPFGSELDPLVVTWLVAGALAIQVVVELSGHEHHVAPDTSPAAGTS
jgi:low temperature requirement protein LtrA